MMSESIDDGIFFLSSDDGASLPEMHFSGGIAERVMYVGNTLNETVTLQSLDKPASWPSFESSTLSPPAIPDWLSDSSIQPGETVLIHAVKIADYEVVKWLLNLPGLSVHVRDSSGRDALSWAGSIADDKKRQAIQACLQSHIDFGIHDAVPALMPELTDIPCSARPGSVATASLAGAYLADFRMSPSPPVPSPCVSASDMLTLDLPPVSGRPGDTACTDRLNQRWDELPAFGADRHVLPQAEPEDRVRNEEPHEWMNASMDEIETWLEQGSGAGALNLRNQSGETVLIRAVKAGRSKLVATLLQQPQIDVNAMDCEGGTALNWAASHGGEAGLRCVESLLQHPDVDPALASPLEWALHYGHAQIADLLWAVRERNAASGGNMPADGQTQEAPGGHAIAAAPDSRNSAPAGAVGQHLAWPLQRMHKQTAVCSAPIHPSGDAPCLPLEESQWDKKIPGKVIDIERWVERYHSLPTPRKINLIKQFSRLSLLNRKHFWIRHAIGGNLATTQFFRASHTEAVIYNERNAQGETALSAAVANEYLAVVEELVSIPVVDVNLADAQGNTPLKRAVDNGNLKIVNLLLQRKDLNPNANSVLLLAVQKAWVQIVRSLLQDARLHVNQAVRGVTALSKAAECGYESVVRMLAMHGQIDMNAGQPLRQAIKHQRIRVVQILVNDMRVKIDAGHLALAKKACEQHLTEAQVAVSKSCRITCEDATEIVTTLKNAMQERARHSQTDERRSRAGNVAVAFVCR